MLLDLYLTVVLHLVLNPQLMKVLSEKENEEVIAWTPSGKAFMILQPKLFVAKILPDEFKSAKYSSFTRKLHRWGFMRHYRGPDAGAFFHKHFQKGRLDLVEKMSCYKPVAPSKPSYNGQGLSGVPEPAPIQTGGGNNVGGESEGLVAGMSGGDSGGQGLALPGAFGGMGAGLDGQPDLNAAIELEVARRLKERISAANAAVMSQQTMMMMPQQQAGFMYPNNPAANIAGGGGFGNMNNLGGTMQGFSQTQQGFGAPQGFGGKNNFDPNNYGMFGGGVMGGASGTNNANQTPQQESPKEN